MKLTTWLKKHKKDYKDLARLLDVDRTTAFKYVNGTRNIPLKRAVQLEKVTKGEVKCRDLS